MERTKGKNTQTDVAEIAQKNAEGKKDTVKTARKNVEEKAGTTETTRKNAEEKKDTAEKEFVSYPDIAEDVINVLLYQGEKVMDQNRMLSRTILLSGADRNNLSGVGAASEPVSGLVQI